MQGARQGGFFTSFLIHCTTPSPECPKPVLQRHAARHGACTGTACGAACGMQRHLGRRPGKGAPVRDQTRQCVKNATLNITFRLPSVGGAAAHGCRRGRRTRWALTAKGGGVDAASQTIARLQQPHNAARTLLLYFLDGSQPGHARADHQYVRLSGLSLCHRRHLLPILAHLLHMCAV